MKKILIVDDEEAILKMYSTTLNISGKFQIITAKNGEDALSLAEKESPDLIYLDIIMPKLNGLDVLKQLKENKETKHIPVIILTNLPEDASADKATSLGANDYFVKVENEPEELLQKTEKIFSDMK
jgi:CheY-like chemotaxis protein